MKCSTWLQSRYIVHLFVCHCFLCVLWPEVTIFIHLGIFSVLYLLTLTYLRFIADIVMFALKFKVVNHYKLYTRMNIVLLKFCNIF